jgi:hypothetical protein
MPRYDLRYFFDEAREKLGYSVELDSLELSENLRREAQHLLQWYDTSIDWSSPGSPSPWSELEQVRFVEAAGKLLERLRNSLGHNFNIRDEGNA